MNDRMILRTGEALVEGPADSLCEEPEVMIEELDGPAGLALASVIGDQVQRHTQKGAREVSENWGME